MTKRNDIYSIFLLLTAGLLAGCSVINEPEQKKEIAVSTGVTGMKKVRSIDSNTALQDEAIKIDAYFHDTETKYLDGAKLVYDVDQWRFDDGAGNEVHYYWPTEGAVYDPSGANITYESLDFVGFCPYAKPAYIGTPTYNYATGVSFTCDMSSYMTLASQTTMDEYLIAVSNEQTLATQTANSGVPLEFKHPLAQVKFVFNTASGTHVQINSIGITDAYTGGTCTYDGTTMSWAGTGSDTVKIALASPLKNVSDGEFSFRRFVDCTDIIPSRKMIDMALSAVSFAFYAYGKAIAEVFLGVSPAKDAVRRAEEKPLDISDDD